MPKNQDNSTKIDAQPILTTCQLQTGQKVRDCNRGSMAQVFKNVVKKSADGHVEPTTTESREQDFLSLTSSSLSTAKRLSNVESVECQPDGNIPNMERDQLPTRSSVVDSGVQVGSPHFFELIQSFRGIEQLYKKVVNAQIDARQKRRAAGYQRRDVWHCDAAFMKELQKLMAEGRLKAFDGLFKLAEECQVVRNSLGPLEQEGIEAEQLFEGEVWRLEKAQESLHDQFEFDLFPGDVHSLGTSSASLSSHQSSSEADDEVISEDFDHDHMERPYRPRHSVASTSSFTFEQPVSEITAEIGAGLHQESILLGVNDKYIPDEDGNTWDLDSGYGDIDLPLDNWTLGELVGPFQPLPRDSFASVERYPELITEFKTTRERINKWLLNTTLLSRLEADVIRQLLDTGESPTPLNWPQLVIAYWALDEAATPKSPRSKNLQKSKKVDQQLIYERRGAVHRGNENRPAPGCQPPNVITRSKSLNLGKTSSSNSALGTRESSQNPPSTIQSSPAIIATSLKQLQPPQLTVSKSHGNFPTVEKDQQDTKLKSPKLEIASSSELRPTASGNPRSTLPPSPAPSIPHSYSSSACSRTIGTEQDDVPKRTEPP